MTVMCGCVKEGDIGEGVKLSKATVLEIIVLIFWCGVVLFLFDWLRWCLELIKVAGRIGFEAEIYAFANWARSIVRIVFKESAVNIVSEWTVWG